MATGIVDVPQLAGLIGQSLPVFWPSSSTRISPQTDCLFKKFHKVRKGTLPAGSHQMPFHYVPRDVFTLWFRPPDRNQIMGATWSGAVLFDTPMAHQVLGRASRILRHRGGKPTLELETTTWQIIEAWEN